LCHRLPRFDFRTFFRNDEEWNQWIWDDKWAPVNQRHRQSPFSVGLFWLLACEDALINVGE
jgi:hypothetical protein